MMNTRYPSIKRGKHFNDREYERVNWRVEGVDCAFGDIHKKLIEVHGKKVGDELNEQLRKTYTQEIQKFASEKFFANDTSCWNVQVGSFVVDLRKSPKTQLVYHVELNEVSLVNFEEKMEGDGSGGVYAVTQPTISYDCDVDNSFSMIRSPCVNYHAGSMNPKEITTVSETGDSFTLSESGAVTKPTSTMTNVPANFFNSSSPREAKEELYPFLPADESSAEYKSLTELVNKFVLKYQSLVVAKQKKEDSPELLLINAVLELYSSVSRKKIDNAKNLLLQCKMQSFKETKGDAEAIIAHAEKVFVSAQTPKMSSGRRPSQSS